MSEIKTRNYYKLPAVVLTIIGGSLILVGGLFSLIWSSSWFYMDNSMMDGGMMMGDMMDGRMGWMMNNGFLTNVMSGLSVAAITSGSIVVVAGIMIYQKPSESQMWGIVALIFSIVGILGMGGFFVGTVLGTLGGILALFLKK